MEVLKLFDEYKPIKSLYETETHYICIPEVETEPLAVFYDKEFNEYEEVYFYQRDVSNEIENAKLLYGERLKF